jgi:hypothetical protein
VSTRTIAQVSAAPEGQGAASAGGRRTAGTITESAAARGGTGSASGTGSAGRFHQEEDGEGNTEGAAESCASRTPGPAGRMPAGDPPRAPRAALRWLAFCCLLAPVALAAHAAASPGSAYGATPFGNAAAAAGLVAVAAGCRLLLHRTRSSGHTRVSPLNDSGGDGEGGERPSDRRTPRRTGARTESQGGSPMHEGSEAFQTRTPGD